ncbi:MAG: hypothetical protein F8N36_13815 [Desulfovibrio sp.]|uniref:hypothetical protein n=1 Tax=Desulfovibrio sp. TaxID=885 RepID=UPI00135D133C|nr:hypothetical protein [Desulfovibrio sp.]MTJ93915.1 hypothetical protein [Desulfovibrio sp.]
MVTGTMSPHQMLLGDNPHLVDAWEDLCLGWPFAPDIVDALGKHITTHLTVVVRDRPAPLLTMAWRRALARYMLVARNNPDPTQLTHEPFVAFVSEMFAAISACLANVEIVCPNGDRWTAMSNVPLTRLSENPDKLARREVAGDSTALEKHLATLALAPPYDAILAELGNSKTKIWLQ